MVLTVCIGFDKIKQKEIFKKFNLNTAQVKEYLTGQMRKLEYDEAEALAEKLSKPAKK